MDLFERGNTLLGRYLLKGKLDAGGMGEVYIAEDQSLGRTVAIKRVKLDPEYSPEQVQSFLQRFRQEAQSVAKLRHPSIVTIHDVQQVEQFPFIVMEFFEGGAPVVEWGQRAHPTIPQWLEVGKQIFVALDHAHSRGILHRDIKSGNVLARGPAAQPEILIIDWGIALNESVQRLTIANHVVGTPGATDPAVLRGGSWTRQSDYFAVGVLLYRALCGRKPHDVSENTPPLNLFSVYAENKIIPPHKANPAIDNDLQTFLVRLLASDPMKRPPSAAAVVAMIECLQRGEDVPFDELEAKYPAPKALNVAESQQDVKQDAENSLDKIIKLAAPGEKAKPREEKPTRQDVKPVDLPTLDTKDLHLVDEDLLKASEEKPQSGFDDRVADFRERESIPKRRSMLPWAAAGFVAIAVILGIGWLSKRKAVENAAAQSANVEIGTQIDPSELQRREQKPAGLDQFAASSKAAVTQQPLEMAPNTRAEYTAPAEPIGDAAPPLSTRVRRAKEQHAGPEIDRSMRPAGVAETSDSSGALAVQHGTRADVRLLEPIDTSAGDPARVQLQRSLVVDATHTIPAGAVFIGRATFSTSGGYMRSQAHFDQVQFPDGSTRKILAYSIKPDGSEGIPGAEFEYGDSDSGGSDVAGKAGQIAANAAMNGVGALPGGSALTGTLQTAVNETAQAGQSSNAKPRKKNRLRLAKGAALTLEFQRMNPSH